jgi:hypothetical protein
MASDGGYLLAALSRCRPVSHDDRAHPSEASGTHPALIVGLFLACAVVFGWPLLFCYGPFVFSPDGTRASPGTEVRTDTGTGRDAPEASGRAER